MFVLDPKDNFFRFGSAKVQTLFPFSKIKKKSFAFFFFRCSEAFSLRFSTKVLTTGAPLFVPAPSLFFPDPPLGLAEKPVPS